MNAEEAVAIGCALFCARHSPASSTRAYDLIENTNVPVKVSWRTLNDPNDTKVTDMEIFPVNYLIPKTKTRNVTLNRVDAKPFDISLEYDLLFLKLSLIFLFYSYFTGSNLISFIYSFFLDTLHNVQKMSLLVTMSSPRAKSQRFLKTMK